MDYKKKGQAAGAVGAIISLVMGVAVATLLMIFTGALGGQTYNQVEGDIEEIGNKSITAEVLTATNGSTGYFLNSNIHDGGNLLIYNTSQTMELGNFSMDYTAGSFVYSPIWELNETQYFANYTYGDTEMVSTIKGGILSSFEAQEQVGNYLPIVVLAVIVFLVLGLVLSMGGIGNGGNSGTAL